ncbi:MAG: hypothetical protein HN952_01815 [Candidatus Cloacimonetes bacterium]|nr:hypothetical protein [Candidatus Cloacimonadota bacterium]MBT7468874.1 hypothetical protein [Candidatus Cloacimonadota bacterium]
MKKLLLFVAMLIVVSLSAEWVDVSVNSQLFDHNSTRNDLTNVNFTLDGYELETIEENGETYQKISYWNEGQFIEEGKPDLPRFTRLIAIPDAGEVAIEIVNHDEQIVQNMNIYPRQKLQIESEPIRNEFVIDTQFYAGNDVFPQKIVEIGKPAIMRNHRVVAVTFNPFQYNPATKELRIISNIEVSVETSGRGGENVKTRNLKKSRYFEKLYESTILNYLSVQNRDDEYQNPSILFIYRNNATVENYIEYLADWKHTKGFEVTLASTSVTGTTTTSIKNYIQNAYNTWENPPEFITLAGDVSGSYSIPTYYESWSGYNGPGDHAYTQLEGGDILADAFIGRLSFESFSQLETIIAKVLYYEKEPYLSQTNWYNKSVMVGDASTSGSSCVHTKRYIKEMMDDYVPNMNITEVYSGNYDSQMSTNINNGVTYFNYRGYYGMSNFNNTDINNLNNGLMLPFAVFLTCDTGTFTNGTCRSEAFIRAGTASNQKGAIAAIGTATTGTHTTFNNCVDAGIFYGVFVDQLYTPGAALVRGKLHLYETFPQNPSNKVDIFSYWNNVMGDPSVELWTSEPKSLTVNYDNNIAVGTNYLEVTVLNTAGIPQENAWVCALKGDDEIFANAFTDNEGKVLLEIDANSAGSLTLTVTKHDFIPHLGSATIVSDLNAISVYTTGINDDNSGSSSGNNDGHVNPGESIELRVSLKNYGSQTANSVTATISTECDFISITDASETFGTIAAGSNVYAADDFDFTVAPNALDGSEIRFDVQIQDGAGHTFDDIIILRVDGINLYASDYTISGEGNGILDPGETADLTVELSNTGSIDATNIVATLSCENEDITINDNYGIYTTIYGGNSASNTLNKFEITAENDVLKGSQIQFKLILSNSDGFNSTVSFILEVGTVTVYDPLGPDSYGYYCYDSGDIAYDLAPVYSWIEINSSGTNLNLNDNGDNGDVADVNVPFNFDFYGIQYNSISVCSNGWIAVGESDNESFMNSPLPSPQGPSPMIAPFWDDLAMSSGDVYYKYDASLHAFIVEWYNVKTEYANSNEKFQVIIYDPDYYPTPSGDAEIVFQYADVNNTSVGSYSGGYVNHGQYSTVGLEDHTGTIGLQYSFNNSYPTAAKQLQDGLALKFTTAVSSVLEPPVAEFSTANFNLSALPNESDSDVLQISNVGEANLIYSISKDYQDEVAFNRDSGGPDNYGYMWLDSNEPGGQTYNWIDISAIGTQVNFPTNDDGTGLMPIGFNFDFYGVNYSQFRINPNGWVGFGNDNNQWENSSIPSSSAPKPAIFGFWDDLYPSMEGGEVYYHSTTERLVVWFDDVVHYNGGYNGTYDFQMVIYANGEILYQYRSVSGILNSATIGMQNATGNDGLQVTYNQNYVENNLAIVFKKVNDWLTISSGSGMIEAGASNMINITADATDLEMGTYECDLIVTTNDPTNSTIIIPAVFTVSNQAQLDPPANVQILVESHATVPGRIVRTLNWNAAVGATSYNVYTSDNPFSEDWGTPINASPITETTFVSEGSSLMKYYRVTAVN